jgi:uncharacterized membrane protein YidH (DUF202 family)
MQNELSNHERLRKEAEKETDPRVDLAVERTELALERTQLAWIRTTLTLLAGGIGLDKAVEYMHKSRLESGDAFFENGHLFGTALSITATILMILFTWFYLQRSRSLARIKGAKALRAQPVFYASILIILMGIGICFLLLVS